MDLVGLRNLVGQLADDFAWLEQHARSQADQAHKAGALRFAAALLRNLIGPFLEKQPATPLHVAVVGGAGAGKSTVANMLCGAVLAESNPQAGFTRHPVAYTKANGQITWPAYVGFLGPLQRLSLEMPASLDQDVYQVRRVPPSTDGQLLESFVVWDCPDMTTWAAAHYVPRLLEISGLADVLVYVASDERYNDEVPTQFLKMLVQAGKSVVVCLVKMKEPDAPAIVSHFRNAVLTPMLAPSVSVLPIPQLSQEQLADPVRMAAPYRTPLVEQVKRLGTPVAAARQRSVTNALAFLRNAQAELLSVARDDLAALEAWRNLVQEGQIEFDNRYRREFLASEKFHRFDEALVKVLDMLELPGVGKILGNVLSILRAPYNLLKGLFTRTVQRAQTPAMPERNVLEAALSAWLDLLRKEATRRGNTHPLWPHVVKGFNTGLVELTKDKFEQGFRGFHLGLSDEVERTARALYEDLERNPVALNTLRGTKFTLEVGAIVGSLATLGLNPLQVLLVPLAASVTHQLVELLGKQYVDRQREQTRARQQALAAQYISGPLAEWLIHWPTTGGSTYERLQVALRRIPTATQQLETAVQIAMKE
ncbi:MAG: 50S ribosome-binding GTPase [Gemmataceae bacterium]|nr:50S ribosome-binding GTPase [Gemmataceae bacterium]